MRHPTSTEHPTPLRGGDEGELLKQILLLELFEVLTHHQGELWFLSAGLESNEGSRMADMPALDWYAAAGGANDPSLWQSFPLWELQRPFLMRGEFLSTTALALRAVETWHEKGIAGRVALADTDPGKIRSLEPYLFGSRPVNTECDTESWPFRFYQMWGDPTQSLRDMAYGGIVRGPGVALLQMPELMTYAGSWLSLIETLMLRKIWVIVTLPSAWSSRRELLRKSSYHRLREGVESLRYPALSYRVKGRGLSWKPHATYEVWVLSPDHLFETFAQRAKKAIHQMFVQGLERPEQKGKVQGIHVERLFEHRSKSQVFDSLFPVPVAQEAQVLQGQERDLPEVVRLWELLMDEHAAFDHHFRRRSLSGLHLRQSLLVQLSQPEHLLLVVRCGFRIVGFLTAQVLRAPLFHTSRIGQIVDVFLLPEWRSQKVGEELVKLAVEWFHSMELTQIDLNVAIDNQVGRGFWAKHGFKPYLHVVSRFVQE